jgi:hypothetical protein
VTRRRPWRAAAFDTSVRGLRIPRGRVAGRTWPGIRSWVKAQRAAGLTVVVWEVLPIPGTGILDHPEL